VQAAIHGNNITMSNCHHTSSRVW